MVLLQLLLCCVVVPATAVLTAAAAAAAHSLASHAAAAAAAHATTSAVVHGACGCAGAAHAAAAAAGHAGVLGTHTLAQASLFSIPSHAASVQALSYSALTAGTAIAIQPEIQLRQLKSTSPSKAAVARILQIEAQRLLTIVRQGGKPMVVLHRVRQTATMRYPIIKWALDTWMQRTLGMDTPGLWSPALKKLIPKSRFGPSLKVLEDELTQQLKFGFRTAPFIALKLVYRSVLIAFVAIVGHWPGFQFLRTRLSRDWPRCVDALAATIERNHAVVVERGMGSLEALRQRERIMRNDVHRAIALRIVELRSNVMAWYFRTTRCVASTAN